MGNTFVTILVNFEKGVDHAMEGAKYREFKKGFCIGITGAEQQFFRAMPGTWYQPQDRL